MKKILFLAAILAVAVFFGVQWRTTQQTERLIKAQRAEFSGHRVTYFEQERLIVLQRPDGSKDGMELEGLRRASLYRMNAAQSANNQNAYFWHIAGPTRVLAIPYFAVDPAMILNMLKKEHPEVDVAWSLTQARAFERDGFNFCAVWDHRGDKVTALEKGRNEYGYDYCAR